MYKLIASDLDGTLLRSDKTISKDTIETLIKLNEKGIIFVPSTGRTHKELPEPILELPFLRYGLCVNGGGLYDYQEKDYFYEATISAQLALEVLDFIENLPIHASFVMKGKRYLQANPDGEVIDFIKKVAVPSILKMSYGCSDIKKFIQENNQGIQKFLLYSTNPEKTEEYIDILTNEFPNLSICSSGPLYIEVNAKGVNKGDGLRRLCQHLHIDIQDTIAFGDAANDIDLLDAAGLAVVMENGTNEAKAHANIITKTNDEDGLRLVLEKIYSL